MCSHYSWLSPCNVPANGAYNGRLPSTRLDVLTYDFILHMSWSYTRREICLDVLELMSKSLCCPRQLDIPMWQRTKSFSVNCCTASAKINRERKQVACNCAAAIAILHAHTNQLAYAPKLNVSATRESLVEYENFVSCSGWPNLITHMGQCHVCPRVPTWHCDTHPAEVRVT